MRLPKLALPRTIQNLDKAGAALLDIPAAYFEGIALNTRAQNEQRQKTDILIEKAICQPLPDAGSAQIDAAVVGLANDYLEKRVRRMRVLEIASEELKEAEPKTDAKISIDEDWMVFFKGKIDNISNEEVQRLFGKVLAGEVSSPGSFSKQSLGRLSELSQDVAKFFEVIFNASTNHGMDVRVLSPRIREPELHLMEEFGLPYSGILLLVESGLIIPDYGTSISVEYAAHGTPFEVGGSMYKLDLPQEKRAAGVTSEIAKRLSRMYGIAFTRSGRELRAIVAKRPIPEYIQKLGTGFASVGLILKAA